jgi:hypothetical protein
MVPLRFPDLPEYPGHIPWSANVKAAHTIVANAYHHALQMLQQEEIDPLRLLRIHIDQLRKRTAPIFETLGSEILDTDWTSDGTELLALLILELEAALDTANGVYVLSSSMMFKYLFIDYHYCIHLARNQKSRG